MTNRSLHQFPEKLWDIWCLASIIGIWPRFIEPYMLCRSSLTLPIPNLPSSFDGIKILQFSDLHLNAQTPTSLLKKLLQTYHSFSPDLVVFTGDFICNAHLEDAQQLITFLNQFEAPLGCFAILGNHDYTKMVSLNEQGDYDVEGSSDSPIVKGLTRILFPPKLARKTTKEARSLLPHPELIQVLSSSPFELLNNRCIQVKREGKELNLVGLGEYMIGKCRPEEAFRNYNNKTAGVILLHNPDALPHLQDYPGELVLCGHTHGDQVNLPWLRTRFNVMEQPHLRRGLHIVSGKKAYINRGIGGCLNFRWFSPPETTLITLKPAVQK